MVSLSDGFRDFVNSVWLVHREPWKASGGQQQKAAKGSVRRVAGIALANAGSGQHALLHSIGHNFSRKPSSSKLQDERSVFVGEQL
jgi:hypothetical protein